MSNLLNFSFSENIVAVSKSFEKVFEEASGKAKRKQLIYFWSNGWTYLVVDSEIVEEENIKQILFGKDKVGNISILFKRSLLSRIFPSIFKEETVVSNFLIYDNTMTIEE